MRILIRRFLSPAIFRGRHLGHSICHGSETDFSGQRVCLFSHYDKHARLDPHVLHYMRALKEAGLSIVLISSNVDLCRDDICLARDICRAIILRENRGWDFAGWALGMRALTGIYNASEIVIANDSVYGPMHPLQEMFTAMNIKSCDIWGVTESREVSRHLQSYFIAFKRPAIASDCFRKFWQGVRVLKSKISVIAHYETRLSALLSDAGLRIESYVQYPGGKNPTLHDWRGALEQKCPFLKVQLLRDNPLKSDLSGWSDMVASRGYDPSLISAHLERTTGRFLTSSPSQHCCRSRC